MARKFNLRQFQTDLSKRMQAAAESPALASRLGFQAAGKNWLLPLDDIEEVLAVPPAEPIPGTVAWFRGITNIRGNLYAITDLTEFMVGAPTQANNDARLLLVHRKHGINAAFLVERALGLRQLGQLTAQQLQDAPAYAQASFTDQGGTLWHELNLAGLLANRVFLSVEIPSSI